VAARHVSTLLSMRLLPFVVFALLSGGVRLVQKAMALVGYLLVVALAWRLGEGPALVVMVAGLTYYLTIALSTNVLRRLMAAGLLRRGGALVLIFFGYLILPGVLLPGLALSVFLVVGCELALSVFSYCVETSRRGATAASLGDCLFFLFVNPTVVYTCRGVQSSGARGHSGWLRAAAGVAVMFANVAIVRPIAHSLRSGTALNALPAGPAVRVVLCGVVAFVALYAAHSGLASIQIGLLRQVGWAVPERYNYPFLSASPIDFWRRWNIYVRVWLEAYVFLPLARRLARRTGHSAAQVAAAAVTLLASAAVHGAVTFSGRQNLGDLKGEFELFAAAAILLAVWRVFGAAGASIRPRLSSVHAATFALVSRVSSRVCVAAAIVAAAIAWG
jgi:hypothetical protein